MKGKTNDKAELSGNRIGGFTDTDMEIKNTLAQIFDYIGITMGGHINSWKESLPDEVVLRQLQDSFEFYKSEHEPFDYEAHYYANKDKPGYDFAPKYTVNNEEHIKDKQPGTKENP